MIAVYLVEVPASLCVLTLFEEDTLSGLSSGPSSSMSAVYTAEWKTAVFMSIWYVKPVRQRFLRCTYSTNLLLHFYRCSNRLVESMLYVLSYSSNPSLECEITFFGARMSYIKSWNEPLSFLLVLKNVNCLSLYSGGKYFSKKTTFARSSNSKACEPIAATTSTAWLWCISICNPFRRHHTRGKAGAQGTR